MIQDKSQDCMYYFCIISVLFLLLFLLLQRPCC